MGFHSFITTDTERSISNMYSDQGAFPVVVVLPDGTQYREDNYEGYGKFGGRSIMSILAEFNHLTEDQALEQYVSDSINCPDTDHNLKHPNIVELHNADGWVWKDQPLKICPHQGYFYDYSEDSTEEK